MSLVVEKGLDWLTMPRLAREADAAVGALYRYFPSKDALMLAVQLQAVGSFGAFLRDRLDTTPVAEGHVGALARVVRAFSGYRAYAVAAPERFGLIDGFLSAPEALLGDDDARAVLEVITPILDACAKTIADAVQTGALREGDAEVRTQTMWGSLHGLGHFQKRDRILPDKLHAERLIEGLTVGLLSGWGADAAAATEALAMARSWNA